MRQHAETSRKCRGRCAARLVCLAAVFAALDAGAASYRVRFQGVPERGLKTLLREESDAFALRDRAPPTDALLLDRGERDVERLLDVLHAAGYYEAQIQVRLAGDAGRRRLIFDLAAGRRYRIGDVALETGEAVAPTRNRLGLQAGQPARAEYVIEAEERLLRDVRLQGYPFPRLAERDYRADLTNALLHVRMRVEPGRSAVFGATSITGLVRVKEGFVREEIEWQERQRYSPKLIDDTRTKLTRSALFSTIRLTTPAEVDDAGDLPVEIALKERRRRTLELGVGYRTDEGAGANALWEHRNLFGGAETLRLGATVAESSQSAEARFNKPQFRKRDQTLQLDVRGANDQPDAYQSHNVRAAATLERAWSTEFSERTGVAFRYSVVDQLDEKDDFVLFSLPSSVDWNTSDDLLDPRRGGRLLASVEPFYDLLSKHVAFAKGTVTANRYVPFDRTRNWVLAGRASAGAIAGAGQTTVPADERFYAGGGSSIRGYAYQRVGPLQDDEPLGGRSLLEASSELRVRLSPKIGVVAFVDGGSAFAASVPDFHENVRWGAGLGLRYFTVVGPVRADVGIPLNKRPGVDNDYQFYVSIGQAF